MGLNIYFQKCKMLFRNMQKISVRKKERKKNRARTNTLFRNMLKISEGVGGGRKKPHALTHARTHTDRERESGGGDTAYHLIRTHLTIVYG